MTAGPDFFLIGAPRSGTTALAAYLGSHPEVFITDPKEPSYFLFDFPGDRTMRRWSDYLSLFTPAVAPKRRLGEASPLYLYSKVAIREIRKAFPEAQLIAILRRPDEMVLSWYQHMRRAGQETAPDLSAAWSLEPLRRRGRRIPFGYRRVTEYLYYSEIARYAAQLERAFAHFPQNRIKVLLHDDFHRDSGRVYREVLEFLGVADDGRTTFPVLNRGGDIGSARLQLIMNWVVGGLHDTRLWVETRTGVSLSKLPLHRAVREALLSLNARRAEPPGDARAGTASAANPPKENETAKAAMAMPVSLRGEIIEAYKSDIIRLSQILNRDLSHWLRAS